MMKYWLGLLVLLNALVMAWQFDAFARWGFGPHQDREPERLSQQIKPEALTFRAPPFPALNAPASPDAQSSSISPTDSNGGGDAASAVTDAAQEAGPVGVSGVSSGVAPGSGSDAARVLAPAVTSAPAAPVVPSAAPSVAQPAASVVR